MSFGILLVMALGFSAAGALGALAMTLLTLELDLWVVLELVLGVSELCLEFEELGVGPTVAELLGFGAGMVFGLAWVMVISLGPFVALGFPGVEVWLTERDDVIGDCVLSGLKGGIAKSLFLIA